MGRDINAVVDDIGMGAYQWVQTLLIGGVLIADGAEILVCSSILGALKDAWHLTPMVRGLMMSTIFLGVLVGGIIGGNVSDAYGRRKGIVMSYIGICVFGTATAAAQGPVSMLIIRFFFGASFGMGMGPGVTMQVETAPSSWRAHIINLGGIFFTFGEVYTSVLLIIFMPELTDPTGNSWRWVSVLSMAPGILLLPFTLLLLQESPAFLITNGRPKEAIESLQYIAHMNNKADKVEGLDSDDPDKRLECNLPSEPNSPTSSADAESAGAGLLASATTEAGARGSASSSSAQQPKRRGSLTVAKEGCSILFSPEYRSIVFGGAYLCMLCNFLFYGLTYALPQMFGDLRGVVSPSVQVLIVSICDLPGVLLAFLLIYAKGISHRTGLMWLGTFGAIFALTLISIEQGPQGIYIGLPSAYLIKYVASALFTLTYVYISEVFPAKVRATGVSICISGGRMGSMSAPVIVESLKIKGFWLGEHAPFLMVTSGLCAVAVLVVWTCLHFERKNVSLIEALPPRSPKESSKEARKPSLKEGMDPAVPVAAG